jgi:hypothetical protein
MGETTRAGRILVFLLTILIYSAPLLQAESPDVLLFHELERRGAFLLPPKPADLRMLRLKAFRGDAYWVLATIQDDAERWRRVARHPNLKRSGLLLFAPPETARERSAFFRRWGHSDAIRGKLWEERAGQFAWTLTETAEEWVIDWWCSYGAATRSDPMSAVTHTRLWLKKDPASWQPGCSPEDGCPGPSYWETLALATQMIHAIRYHSWAAGHSPQSPADLSTTYGKPICKVWSARHISLYGMPSFINSVCACP